jgi:hypothetical protein
MNEFSTCFARASHVLAFRRVTLGFDIIYNIDSIK